MVVLDNGSLATVSAEDVLSGIRVLPPVIAVERSVTPTSVDGDSSSSDEESEHLGSDHSDHDSISVTSVVENVLLGEARLDELEEDYEEQDVDIQQGREGDGDLVEVDDDKLD